MSTEEHIDIKEAIALLNTSQPTFYRWLREGRVKGHKVGRQWRFVRADIEAFARGEKPALEIPEDCKALRQCIQEIITKNNYKLTTEEANNDIIENVINELHLLACVKKATELHLDAQENGGQIRLRVDGQLENIASYSAALQEQLCQSLKGLYHCNTQITDIPQDGRTSYHYDEQKLDCRITAVPTLYGESVVLRFLIPAHATIELKQLGIPDHQYEIITKTLTVQHGLILVTGPTGSGKTTTLYSLINHLNEPHKKIISIEEPIEHSLPGVQQIPASDQKLPAIHAMRAALRCMPDVLMISQLTSREQIHLTSEAALTGHLVLTQLHCDTAIEAIQRLRDVEVSPDLIADTLRMVIAQRLMRKLCPHCALEYTPNEHDEELIKRICQENGISRNDLPNNWKVNTGCEHCNQIGYRGRMAVNEVLPITSALRSAISADQDREALRDCMHGEGFNNLEGEALLHVANGETTINELRRLQSN